MLRAGEVSSFGNQKNTKAERTAYALKHLMLFHMTQHLMNPGKRGANVFTINFQEVQS